MQADSGGEAIADINVTPMVDLYLVLLLIFIIMTSAGIQGVKVNLPKGSSAPSMGLPVTRSRIWAMTCRTSRCSAAWGWPAARPMRSLK